jgi:hypothetical protein
MTEPLPPILHEEIGFIPGTPLNSFGARTSHQRSRTLSTSLLSTLCERWRPSRGEVWLDFLVPRFPSDIRMTKPFRTIPKGYETRI